MSAAQNQLEHCQNGAVMLTVAKEAQHNFVNVVQCVVACSAWVCSAEKFKAFMQQLLKAIICRRMGAVFVKARIGVCACCYWCMLCRMPTSCTCQPRKMQRHDSRTELDSRSDHTLHTCTARNLFATARTDQRLSSLTSLFYAAQRSFKPTVTLSTG